MSRSELWERALEDRRAQAIAEKIAAVRIFDKKRPSARELADELRRRSLRMVRGWVRLSRREAITIAEMLEGLTVPPEAEPLSFELPTPSARPDGSESE